MVKLLTLLLQERNDVLNEPLVRELQVIAHTRDKMQFALLVHILETEPILLIQLRLVQCLLDTVLSGSIEAKVLAGPRLHHGVLGELHHDKGIETLQVGDVRLILRRQFVVHAGQPDVMLHIIGLIQRVVPILRLHQYVLDERHVGANVQQPAHVLAQTAVCPWATRHTVDA